MILGRRNAPQTLATAMVEAFEQRLRSDQPDITGYDQKDFQDRSRVEMDGSAAGPVRKPKHGSAAG